MDNILIYLQEAGIWGYLSFFIVFLALYFTVRDFLRFKKLKQKQVDLAKKYIERKCKGPHNWVDIDILEGKTHVCKDCYFSPKYDNFVKSHYVNAQVKQNEYIVQAEEYKTKRMMEICEKYGIEEELAQSISDEVVSIKKDFALMKLDEALAEIKGE